MVFRTIAGTKKRKKAGKGFIEKVMPVPLEKPTDFNTIWKVIQKRKSVRKYHETPLDDKTVYTLLEAAAHAPSEGSQQPWEFIVVKDSVKKQHLAEAAYNQNWMAQAPIIIVACQNMRLSRAVYGERGERLYGIQAVAAAIENILLTAQSMGLSTCWVGSFSEPRVAVLTRCPDYVRPAAMITVGHGAEDPESPILQKPDDYMHLEEFGRTLLLERVIEEKAPIGKGKSEVEYWAKTQ